MFRWHDKTTAELGRMTKRHMAVVALRANTLGMPDPWDVAELNDASEQEQERESNRQQRGRAYWLGAS